MIGWFLATAGFALYWLERLRCRRIQADLLEAATAINDLLEVAEISDEAQDSYLEDVRFYRTVGASK